MDKLEKRKSRRVRGAELVVTGGITLLLSKFVLSFGPIAICCYGAYRWLFRKSYRDGITALAVGILTMVLINGPFSFIEYLLYGAGGVLLAVGGIMMILPGRQSKAKAS